MIFPVFWAGIRIDLTLRRFHGVNAKVTFQSHPSWNVIDLMRDEAPHVSTNDTVKELDIAHNAWYSLFHPTTKFLTKTKIKMIKLTSEIRAALRTVLIPRVDRRS